MQITIRHRNNELFRYIITLDKDNRVVSIENDWDISDIPVWIGLTFDLGRLQDWINTKRPELYI